MVRSITCNGFHMRQFCIYFNCLGWFDTVEFNWLPCSKNNMYDNASFADRFHCQLTMLGNRVLIGLSRLLHAQIAYEIDTTKIIAAFCRISYCLHNVIRLNSIVCHVQTTWCTMMWLSMIDSNINWLCLKCLYSQGYHDSLILILHMKSLYKKITTGNWLDAKNDLPCMTVVKR